MQHVYTQRDTYKDRFYYGVVGNGETAALVGPDLAIDWLCLPRFDGTPFFAAALDPQRGGQLTIKLERIDGEKNSTGYESRADNSDAAVLVDAVPVEQQYVGRTNVLATSLQGEGVRLQVVDSMPWGEKLLVRRMTVTNTGDAPEHLRLSFDPNPVRSAHWAFRTEVGSVDVSAAGGAAGQEGQGARGLVKVVADEAALVIGWVLGADVDGAAAGAGGAATASRATRLHEAAEPHAVELPLVQPGEVVSVVLLLAYGRDVAEAEANWHNAGVRMEASPPGDPDGLQRDKQFWTDWLAQARFPQGVAPELEEAYARGLLALKLLTHEESGAILAAATASFPAVPGGADNWDYRYCWLRDGYYSARTYDAACLHDEARAFYEFALRCQAEDGRWRQPLYTLDGGGPVELIIEDLVGPDGERPIRFGNAAYDQLQIDNEPSVLHGLWIHAQATGDRDWFAARWEAIRRAADAMMELWHQPENGIWEIRERRDHWVYGKSLCAAGFRAAAALARWLGHDDDAARWEAEAEKVAEQVIANGYSSERQAYLQTYDKNSPLDISALALVLWDLLPADDERIVQTIRAFEEPLKLPEAPVGATEREQEPTTDDPYWGMHHLKGGLRMNGAFARYDYAAEPFYLPTLWMARYYLRAGQRARAEQLVRLCLDKATNLGLMAEHFDPRTGRQWGNFPQAFSHEEMALTILELAAAGNAR